MTRNYQLVNYQEKLSQEIIRRNYPGKLSASILCRVKCGNYRDTGVSKKRFISLYLFKVKFRCK